mgnify:CR=1 FL=1
MAKSLHTLIRLHQHRIDQKRRELGGMIGVVLDLERQAGVLEERITKEQDIAKSSPDLAGVFYGNFAAHSILRREQFVSAIAEMEEKLLIAQGEIREEYTELKGFELTQEVRDKADALQQSRSERAMLDEIGSNVYRQKKLKGTF